MNRKSAMSETPDILPSDHIDHYLAWCVGATPVKSLSGQVPIHPEQAEAMCRLLVDEGHMTPVATMQLRKLWTAEPA